MFDRLGSWLGVDARQWRALVLSYLKMDFRAAGGALRSSAEGRKGGAPITGILIVMGLSGAAFAAVAAVIPDVLLSAALLMTYSAINTIMLLLVDFTGVVVSPHDYMILGPRPVDSRTYFAARLTSVTAYVAAISLTLAFFPSLSYAFWRGLGAAALPITLGAVLLCNVAATVLVIAGYVFLLGFVHPGRLRRATTYLQLAASMGFYGLYYLATVAFRHSFLDQVGFSEAPWLWANPASWFAAFVPLAGGQATRAEWLAAAAAVALLAVCVPLGAGRLSLDYAQRLGEITAVAEPARTRRRGFALPGFGRNEARAVALLVRAQFRFDQRFRMAVLSILPLTAFYLLLGSDAGALVDPFSPRADTGGMSVYFAVLFVPMTLHASLSVSESWRAAWVFFATPASHARIVVAAKNFVTIYLLGGYLLLLAGVWATFYDRIWHAAVHAIFIGMLAHLLLQVIVIVKPLLPFAAEPRRGERSVGLMLTFFVAALFAGTLPVLLPSMYARPAITIGAFLILVLVTAAMEYALRLRVDEAIGELEFRA
jgi:hypothetical protein